MRGLRRALRLMQVFISATISAQLEYRANFLGALLGTLVATGTSLFALGLVLGQPGTTGVGGWTLREALLVTAFYLLTSGFIAVFIRPNMSKIAEAVRTGNMDFTLLKPIDAQLNVSTRNVDILRFPDLLIGAGLMVYAATGLTITASGVLGGTLLYLSSLVIVYCIWLALSTTAFWFVKTQNATELFQGVFSAARFPSTAFPAPVRAFLTVVVPIAFITTVPAQALLGRLTLTQALASPLVAAVLFAATRWFWLKAVGSYTSASS